MEIVEIQEYSSELEQVLKTLLPQLSPTAPVLTEATLRQVIAAEASHLLMAAEQGRYCGTLTVVIVTAPAGKRARIEDVVVAETMRGRGVGRLMIARALQLARDLGADSVELTSHPSRQSANLLYRSMGFRPRETQAFTYSMRAWKT